MTRSDRSASGQRFCLCSLLRRVENVASLKNKCAAQPYLVSDISSPAWHSADAAASPGHIWCVHFVIISAHLLIRAPSLQECCTAFIPSDRICLKVYFLPLLSVFPLSSRLRVLTHTQTLCYTHKHTSPSFSCHSRLGMALERIY